MVTLAQLYGLIVRGTIALPFVVRVRPMNFSSEVADDGILEAVLVIESPGRSIAHDCRPRANDVFALFDFDTEIEHEA